VLREKGDVNFGVHSGAKILLAGGPDWATSYVEGRKAGKAAREGGTPQTSRHLGERKAKEHKACTRMVTTRKEERKPAR